MARVVVTGAAGFIGAHTARELLTRGDEVVGVDVVAAGARESANADAPTANALQRHRLAWLFAHERFTYARADITPAGALERALPAGVDAVIHLAARAGVRASVANPRAYLDANLGGTLAVLELCRARAIPKLVLASTSSVYGASRALPFREEQPTARPLSPYAATKQACETLAHSYHALHGLDVSVLRYFTVYGPAGRPDMAVLRFVQRIARGEPVTVYGDGAMQRDFSFVSDVARGTAAALRPLGYEIINLAAAAPHSVRDLLAAVEKHTGETARVQNLPPHPADVPGTQASIEKAARLLDWQPRVSLDEGIRQTVAWYRAEENWARALVTD